MKDVVARALARALVLALVAFPALTSAAIREGESTVRIHITTHEVPELPAAEAGRGPELPPEEAVELRVIVETDSRHSHRQRQPVCQPTVDDTVGTYGLTGWRLPAGPFPYLVDARRADRDIRDLVQGALERSASTWTAADPATTFAFAGTARVSSPQYDGRNVVLWKGLPRGIIAAAYLWVDPVTHEVVDADMVFNSFVDWAVNDQGAGDCGGDRGAYDVQAVATHEFGHFVGLEDLLEPTAADLTMHGIVTVGEIKKATLGHGDILGANAVPP